MGLIIPRQLIPSTNEASLPNALQVHLQGDDSDEPVVGEFTMSRQVITFESVVPLTRSLTYAVKYNATHLGDVTIPPDPGTPAVSRIFPTQDSLPENLLKMYIEFSHPMREANPLEFIRVIDDNSDTVQNVFLDLRPALWNRDGTVLTLWLDPGRIKRDLQPNQRTGLPLRSGKSYELIVMEGWPSKDGSLLAKASRKAFVAIQRDDRSPDLSEWLLEAPRAGTSLALTLKASESLDHTLLNETLDVMRSDGVKVQGSFTIMDEERVVTFTPAAPWTKGTYFVRCESRLEDLAGNNLNRLFDQDIIVTGTPSEKPFYERLFTVQ